MKRVILRSCGVWFERKSSLGQGSVRRHVHKDDLSHNGCLVKIKSSVAHVAPLSDIPKNHNLHGMFILFRM